MDGLERREQPAKRVIIIGAGMAGLVAGYELARAGHDPLILEAQNRVGGRVYTLRKFAPGPVRRGGRDAHPARPRPDARLLRALRPRAPPVPDGQPEGPRARRRAADDRRAGRPHAGRAGLRRCRPRARALRIGPVGGGDEGAQGDARGRPRRRLGAHRPRVRQLHAARVPRGQGLLRGRHRDVRRHELRRGRHQQRGHGGVPRGLRQGVRGHAGDRRRLGQPAERLLSRAGGPDPVRRGGPRDRPGHAIRSRSTSRPRPGGTPSRATTRSSRSRSRSCARSRS